MNDIHYDAVKFLLENRVHEGGDPHWAGMAKKHLDKVVAEDEKANPKDVEKQKGFDKEIDKSRDPEKYKEEAKADKAKEDKPFVGNAPVVSNPPAAFPYK